MYRIFLVEDDRGIAEAIAARTALWDMETVCVKDFRAVMAEFAACDPHLVLMDVSLPFFDGYHWCREIRSVSNVPVIFISSASDNLNLVYVAVLSLDGETVYAEQAPGAPTASITLDATAAINNARGYVAVFAGDYAGNEAAVAVKVKDKCSQDKTIYVLTH